MHRRMPLGPRGRLALAGVLLALTANPAAAQIEQTVVFTSGEGGYHTYRIPAVIAAANGDLLAFCEGRRNSAGDSGDIDLLMKRSRDGGRTWGRTQVIWDDGSHTCGNPCPVLDRATGTILLLMTHNRGEDVSAEIRSGTGAGTRTVWICRSTDHGASWTKPRNITDQTKRPDWRWYATGPGVGIQIAQGPHSGRLVIPCDHSDADPQGTQGGKYGLRGSHVIYSDDHGQSWQVSEQIGPQMNECQVVELAETPGRLLINMRSYRGHHCRARAISDDGGESWSKPVDAPELIGPVCQASLIRIERDSQGRAGGLLLFSNPAHRTKRIKLTIKSSPDAGASWSSGLRLWDGPSAYSCLVELEEGVIGCLYERGDDSPYETITFARVPLERLASGVSKRDE